MGAGARRSRALTVALAAFALLPALPAVLAAAADDQSVSVQVHVGYHDVVRAGEWMPVTVDLTNSGSNFTGSLDIGLQDNPVSLVKVPFSSAPPQPGLPGSAVYQVPLTLAAGATKQVRTFVLSDVPGTPLTVRLDDHGRLFGGQSVSAPTTARVLVGVLSDTPAALDEFGAVRLPGGAVPQVVHLQAGELPDSAVYLRAFNMIAVDDFPADQLTASQRAALLDYVAQGGNLLLAGGGSWRKTLGIVPAAVLPIRVTGTTVRRAGASLGGLNGVELDTGEVQSGFAWLKDGSLPLVVEAGVGDGLLTFTTFDWTQDPIASWGGTRNLLRQVAVRMLATAPSDQAPVGVGGGGPFPADYSAASVTQRSNLLMPALINLPGLELPSLQLTGLLVLLYVLVVGPANYLVLRALGRRELAWFTVPALAILFSAGAYGLGVVGKGRAVQSSQATIVHIPAGWTHAYQESYTGVLTPTRGDYAVSVAGERPAIAPIATVYGGSGSIQGRIRIRPVDRSVDLLGVTAYTLRGFATEATVTAPRLKATVQFAQGRFTGTVRNDSSLRISDAVMIAGDAYQSLGPLEPGASAPLDLQPRLSSTIGPAAFTRLYPNMTFGNMPSDTGSDAQRRGEERTQMLQLIFPNAGQLPATVADPVIVAWTGAPSEGVMVNGARPKGRGETAFVIHMVGGPLGSGALPAGLVIGRPVDFTGEVTLSSTGTVIQDGSVTYELRPELAPGVRLSGAAISASSLAMMKFVPAPGIGSPGPIFTGAAWDWARQSWTPLTFQAPGLTALPQSALEPGTGAVRLRVESHGSASIPLGSLSLTGTLR
jgi:hypothetical protein